MGSAELGRRKAPTLFRFREPAFWVFAVIVAVTGWITAADQSVYRQISAGGWLLAWVLVLVYGLPVLVVIFALDQFERGSLTVVGGAVVWGAVAATTLAAIANGGWSMALARLSGPDFASKWVAVLTAPWVEESLKLCGVVLLCSIARERMRDLMDGFVYGAMCGLGFALVEDVFYFMGVFGGQPTGVLQGFFVRAAANGLYGHLLYTGLGGVGVAYFVTRRRERSLPRRVLVTAVLIVAGVAAHFLWNSPWTDLFPRQGSMAGWSLKAAVVAIKALPFALFVAVMVLLRRAREKKWLAEVAEEVEGPAISLAEMEALRSRRMRRKAVRRMRSRAGPHAARLLRRLQREQMELAMIRSRAAAPDEPVVVRQRDYCISLRDALEAIPAAAPASG